MTDTLSEGWNVPKTRTYDGEIYHVHGEKGRGRRPYGYFTKESSENAAKRLHAAGWLVRSYTLPRNNSWTVLYKRKN